MTQTALQNFLTAQATLASLARLGPRVYNGEYQEALKAERLTKIALIAEQNNR
jgi:hypothetical protein